MARAASVPKFLTHDLFTVGFWEEVDRVTMGILELLLPMINFVGELEVGVGALPLTEIHQRLHSIVAEAGWLANGMNLTRSCFWIDFPQPGQLWDVRQEHVTDVTWTASKAFADYNDDEDSKVALKRWRQARQPVYNALVDDSKPPLGVWSKRTYELDNPRPRQVRRTAKVQISMWPFFQRSYPHEQDLVSGDFNSGESVTVLQKAQVVYYAGDDTDAGEQREDYTLKQYLEDYKRSNAIFWGPRAWISWPVIIALFLLALYFARPNVCAAYDEIRHSHWDLPDYVTPNWSWPTWNWPGIGWPRTRHGGQPLADPLLSGSPSRSTTRKEKSNPSKKTSTNSEEIPTPYLRNAESSSSSK